MSPSFFKLCSYSMWSTKNCACVLLCSLTGMSLLDHGDRAASRSSLDSHETVQTESSVLEKFRSKVASIVKGGNLSDCEQTVTDSPVTTVEEEEEEQQECKEESKNFKINFTPPESPSEYRILSRSESAGDANIIDKLQQNNRKNCSRVLNFNGNDHIEEGDRNSPGK